MWPFDRYTPLPKLPTETDVIAALHGWADGATWKPGILALEAGDFLRRYKPQDYYSWFSLTAAETDLDLRKRFLVACLDNWRSGRVYDPKAPEFSREALGSALVV
jgi:hypothetical protein